MFYSYIKFLSIALAAASVSTTVLAVEMARCPATVTVSVEGIQTLSDAEIRKQFEVRGYPHDEPIVMELRDLLNERLEIRNLTFVLYRRERSQCGYWLKGNPLPPKGEGLDNETRFYTTKGTNVLRIALNVSDDAVVNAFAIVKNYGASGLTIKPETKTGIYGYSNWDSDHRGVRFKVGNAQRVSVH